MHEPACDAGAGNSVRRERTSLRCRRWPDGRGATLAILAGTQLGPAVPDGDPAKLIAATATLAALVGLMLLLAAVLRLGFVATSSLRRCSPASRRASAW